MITEKQNTRYSPLEITPDDFRKTGYKLVDRIADLLETLPSKPVSSGNNTKGITN